jgi:hypothetical protein
MHITIAAPKAPQARRVPTLAQRLGHLAWQLFEVCLAVALVAGVIATAERIAQSVARLS